MAFINLGKSNRYDINMAVLVFGYIKPRFKQIRQIVKWTKNDDFKRTCIFT